MADAKKIIATTAGVAAATGLAVAAKKKLDARSEGSGKKNRDGSLRPKVIYHVKPDGEVWTIEAEDGQRASSRHDTKKAALGAARELANRHAPSRLVIHRSDGTIQRQHAYGLES